MAWTTLYLKTRPNKEGRVAVVVTVCVNGKRVRLGTGVLVKPDDWNDARKEVRRTEPLYAQFNSRLGDRIAEIEREIALRLQNPSIAFDLTELQSDLSARQVVPMLTVSAEPETLMQMYDRFIEAKRSSVAARTVAKYETLQALLLEFGRKGAKVEFANITHDFGDAFTKFLLVKKKHTNNTVGKYISTFKTFLAWAEERGAKFSRDYVKFRVPEEDVEIVALTGEELQQLVDYDLVTNDRLNRVRDLFLFACYTGARFSDVQSCNLDDVRDDVWHLRMHKTRTETHITLNKHARRILAAYSKNGKGLPKISSQKMNDYLKELGKLVGLDAPVRIVRYRGSTKIEERGPKWEFLSSHVARRTFVTLSLERGMRAEVLMTFTGHKSHKTMKRYIALTEIVRKEEMEKAWG